MLRRSEPGKVQGLLGAGLFGATQNLLLAAAAKGLGAVVWTGVYPMEDRVAGMQKLPGLPEQVVPLSLVPIGFPAEQPGRSDRFDASRVHKDRW